MVDITISEICGDYALNLEYSDETIVLFFNSHQNALNVKRIIEVDRSVPNAATVADFVEVVRCKDCKHKFNRRIFGNIMCGRTAIIKNGIPYGLIATGDNQFCSYGESKTNLPDDVRQNILNTFMKGSED